MRHHFIYPFSLLFLCLQGTRMEERLDDALNVLRNHCEPQLGIQISNLDGPYVGSPAVVTPGPITQENPPTEPPPTVKLERVSSNSSEFHAITSKSREKCNDLIPQRKERSPQMPILNQVVAQ